MGQSTPFTQPANESPAHDLYERTQRVREDIVKLSGDARRTMVEWEGIVREQLIRSPYAVLGAAAALGYVLGGGVPRLLVRVALVAVGRIALENTLMAVAHRDAR